MSGLTHEQTVCRVVTQDSGIFVNMKPKKDTDWIIENIWSQKLQEQLCDGIPLSPKSRGKLGSPD